jgi:hypothetical protein
MAITQIPDAPSVFASEYDEQLFALALLILRRCAVGRDDIVRLVRRELAKGSLGTHEAYYVHLQKLTPEQVEAAERFARDIQRWKSEHTATVIPAEEMRMFAASLDRIVQTTIEERKRELREGGAL